MRKLSATVDQQIDRVLEHPRFLQTLGAVSAVSARLPHVPGSIVALFGKIVPWFVLVGGLLSLMGSLETVSYGLGASPYWSTWVSLFPRVPRLFFLAVGSMQLLLGALLLLAYVPLKRYQRRGWLLLALTLACSVVVMLAGLVFAPRSLVQSILNFVTSLYVLFELRPLYTQSIARKSESTP